MAYEKTNQIPIGTDVYPWPTLVRSVDEVDGETVFSSQLNIIADRDNPLIIPSARSFAEVMGILYRNMPVRSMLPALEFLIARMDPRQNNRIGNIVAGPGVGKSFLCIILGLARDPRGPIVTDAGGKNLEYLLFQTVFDTQASRALTDIIDQKLASGTLSPPSVNELKKLGRHFSKNGDRYCIDWNGLSEGKTYEPDADGHAAESLDADKIRQILETVRMYEGLDNSGIGVGFKVIKGPLVVAHEEGRDIVIDELNKCKEGSETPLQIVWQVLNGETAEHTVQLGSLGPFTFRRGRPGTVFCTGNLPKDGKATHLISESFDRRVPSYRIPDFDADDWQDRTAQILTSLPIPLLSRMVKGEWKDIEPPTSTTTKDTTKEKQWVVSDAEDFSKLLYELSTLGMNEDQRRNTKDWQLSQIGNWLNVLEATKKLGDFYYKWSQLVDPESALLKNPAFANIALEVSNDDNPTEKVTPSTMIRQIEQALVIGPAKKPAEQSPGFGKSRNWDMPVTKRSYTPEPIETNFGLRLVQAIMDEVYRTTIMVGKKELYTQIMVDAKEAGLVGDPPPIAALLNLDPAKVAGSTAQAKIAQSTHTALLRQFYPDLKLSDIDEDILPIQLVKAALRNLSGSSPATENTVSEKALNVLNTDLENVEKELLKPASTVNIQADEDLIDAKKRLPPDELLDLPTLLYSLAVPVLGEQNLNALWNKNFSQGHFIPDEATAIAENQSDHKLAITTVICRGETSGKDYQTLHLFKNGVTGRTIIIGDEAIPNDLYDRLNRNKIIYVPRSHAETEQRLAEEFKGISDKRQREIMDAFLMRNASMTKKTPNLVDMMMKETIYPPVAPVFATRSPVRDIHTGATTDATARQLLAGLGLK